MRARAAWMASSPGRSIGVVATSPEVDELADPRASRFGVDVLRRGEVFDRETYGLEESNVVRRLAAGDLAGQHLTELADDVRVIDGAVGSGQEDVAGFLQRGLAMIDDETRPANGVRIELARVGDTGAHGVDVRALGEPGSLHHRLARRRHDADDVGAGDRLLDRRARSDRDAVPFSLAVGEALRALEGLARDAYAPERPN